MRLRDYIERFGPHPFLSERETIHNGAKVLYRGMLQFDETASSWAEPFPGGYAYCIVLDYRTARAGNESYCRALDRALELDIRELKKQILLPKKERRPRWQNYSTDQLEGFLDNFPMENATSRYPIRIWVMGTDNTSYSKFVPSEEEALDEVALMEACQPLNMRKDIHESDYISTN